jgi:hypothetical protein
MSEFVGHIANPDEEPNRELNLSAPTTDFDLLPLQYRALKQWWERHCRSVSTWFIALSMDDKVRILSRASPDIPKELPTVRKQSGIELKPTDIILPELSLDGLLACNGMILILLITRRCAATDYSIGADLKFLNELYKANSLPSFTTSLKHLDTPFVDILDPDETIQALGKNASPAMREQAKEHMATGLMHYYLFILLLSRIMMAHFLSLI